MVGTKKMKMAKEASCHRGGGGGGVDVVVVVVVVLGCRRPVQAYLGEEVVH